MPSSAKNPLAVLSLFLIASSIASLAVAQTPSYANVGRKPTPEEIKAWDIAVGPSGKELPPGSGTAKEGAAIYAQKCASCHMANLEGSPAGPRLVGGKGTLSSDEPIRTVGSFWAYATTVWDFTYRSMPKRKEGTLTADEVYALTAYILFKNDIVKETDAMDAKTLPQVKMPNRDGFVPGPLPDYKRYNAVCPVGKCR